MITRQTQGYHICFTQINNAGYFSKVNKTLAEARRHLKELKKEYSDNPYQMKFQIVWIAEQRIEKVIE